MLRRSSFSDVVLVLAGTALYYLSQNIFGNLLYAWLKAEFEAYTGILESDLVGKLSQVFASSMWSIGIVWFLYRYISRDLRNELQAERSEDRQALWMLREEGVQLRNRGISTYATANWEKDFKRWHAAVLALAARVSMDLRHSLDPLDKLSMEPVQCLIPQHQINVSVASEMLKRIKDYLVNTQR
jgi:hypothetical protein